MPSTLEHLTIASPRSPSRIVTVYVPERQTTGLPVLLLHDGQNLFDPNAAFGGVTWRVPETMDVAANDGRFIIGSSLAVADHVSLLVSTGIGLTDDSPDFQFQVRLFHRREPEKPLQEKTERATAVFFKGGGGKAVPLRRFKEGLKFRDYFLLFHGAGVRGGKGGACSAVFAIEKELPLRLGLRIGGYPLQRPEKVRCGMKETFRGKEVQQLFPLQACVQSRSYPVDRYPLFPQVPP